MAQLWSLEAARSQMLVEAAKHLNEQVEVTSSTGRVFSGRLAQVDFDQRRLIMHNVSTYTGTGRQNIRPEVKIDAVSVVLLELAGGQSHRVSDSKIPAAAAPSSKTKVAPLWKP
ncbi:hypothetical protein M3Y99_01032400 [Aphelenchoides fujianensis]|nr:hypothetical protein M3Y99_01032400 [Aphelenchoides fujianensis]